MREVKITQSSNDSGVCKTCRMVPKSKTHAENHATAWPGHVVIWVVSTETTFVREP